jgi:hypothetical protein
LNRHIAGPEKTVPERNSVVVGPKYHFDLIAAFVGQGQGQLVPADRAIPAFARYGPVGFLDGPFVAPDESQVAYKR